MFIYVVKKIVLLSCDIFSQYAFDILLCQKFWLCLPLRPFTPLHNVVGLEMRLIDVISIIISMKYSFLKHFLNFGPAYCMSAISVGVDICSPSGCCSNCQEGYSNDRDDPCSCGMYEH